MKDVVDLALERFDILIGDAETRFENVALDRDRALTLGAQNVRNLSNRSGVGLRMRK